MVLWQGVNWAWRWGFAYLAGLASGNEGMEWRGMDCILDAHKGLGLGLCLTIRFRFGSIDCEGWTSGHV